VLKEAQFQTFLEIKLGIMSFNTILRYGILSQVGEVSPIPTNGLTAWYGDLVNDGTDRTTLSDGTAITQWDDLSGNGWHVTGTTGNYPVYSADTNAIYFDSSSGLHNNDYNAVTGGSKITIFQIIAERQRINRFLWLGDAYNNNGYIYGLNYTDPRDTILTSRYNNSSTKYDKVFQTGRDLNTFNLHTLTLSGDSINDWGFRVNTVTQSSTVEDGGTDMNYAPSIGIGAQNYNSDNGSWNYSNSLLDYKEFIIYNRALSTSEIQQVEAYLVNKYLWDGLTAYYAFDETSGSIAYDSKGSNDGTANNSRVLGSTGFHNNGADFTQGTDYINVGFESFGSKMGKSSISFWFSANTQTINNSSIFGSLNDDTSMVYQVYINTDDSLNFYIRDKNSFSRGIKIDISSILGDNNWHHVVLIVDAPTLTSYIDGELSDYTMHPTSTPSSFNDFDYPLIIGGRNLRGVIEVNFNGNLDEFGIWNRILTESEITTLYNSGNGLFY